MSHLDPATALRGGGWDARFTRVLLVAEHEDVAIALFDANSDMNDLNLENFQRSPDGNWYAGGISTSVGEWGSGYIGNVAYCYGQATPGASVAVEFLGKRHTAIASQDGWWALVAALDPAP